MMDERLQEQASAYALGVLPEDERPEFERAMEGDPELQKLVTDFINTLGEAARNMAKQDPGADLKRRVLSQISRQSQFPPKANPESKTVSFPIWIPWAAAAAIAIFAAKLLVDRGELRSTQEHLASALQRAEDHTNDLARELAQAQQSNQELLTQVSDARDRQAVLESETERWRRQIDDLRTQLADARSAADLAAMRVASLKSQVQDQPSALAVSLWNDSTQEGVLVVENLSLPPPGKTYQLWVLDPTTKAPIDAGIFTTDSAGRGHIVFRPKSNVKTAAQFAVSLEKDGGVPSPQGPIVMLGATTSL